ncbi:MAG: acriflavine resistance protein B [Confluentimicrobium sp.]|nr:acriflavine resistance protein B [Actibacterium sp.]MBF54128.1 acriflavine resistance protein B [Actibacterium sp.]
MAVRSLASDGRASGILSYFTRHRTAANLVVLLLIVAGLAAFPRMRAQFFPDIVTDEIDVSVTWDGAGAEDVDGAIVELLEPALLAVEGVESSESRSSEGRASIELTFEPGWDMGRAADDVQQAVDALSNLPDDADEPRVSRGGWRDRVTDVVVNGPVGVDQLGRFADEMVTRLFAEGVTQTTIRGVVAPEVLVEVPTAELIRNDVSMSDIASAIAAEAEADPAGDVEGANARVRTGTAKRAPDQIEGIVLRSNADGSQLTVGDVAQVRVLGIDRERTYYVGDNQAVSIRVDRSQSGDAIDIQRQVEAVAEDMMLSLPEGVRIDLIRTRSEEITGRLDILLENGLTGLALVVGLLFLFLNARTAIWVAAGIPVAMLAAIALMYAAGLTLNMISLFALIITLGIVVDDAIVVGEHADFRHRKLGESPVVAAETAARRMAGPVFSATVTTVLAFSGLTMIEGRFGDMISDIPFTVIVVLIASLAECFLILPNHMAHALAASNPTAWYDAPSRTVNRGFNWVQLHLFRPLMRGVIRARYPVLGVMVLILTTQVVLFVRGDVQWRFFSSPEQPSVSANFAMAPGARREDTFEQMRMLQDAVAEIGARYEAEYGLNPIAYALAEIGGNTGRALAGSEDKDADQLGSMAVELIEPDLRPYSSYQFVEDLTAAVPQHPLTETLSFRRWGTGPGGDSLDVQISGAEVTTLKAAAEALKTAVSQFGEVSAVEDTLAYDKEEMVLELTPQGQALGFTIGDLGQVLSNRLGGIEAATYPVGSRSAAIRVELPEAELTADFLDTTRMRTASGDYVPLADIVNVETRSGFSTIRRENGIRVVSVFGDISEDDPARAQEVTTQIQEEILPGIEERFGVITRMSGLAEQEQDFLSDALLGFGFCLAGIYLTLAWVFSSWTRPVLIMAVIPFGLVGTIYGHAAWDIPLSMFTVVGLIGMSGIIINDSIVLVTTVDEYAAERGLLPAIIDGVSDRLRPVLLTTLTTVLGLAPLLYEPSSQAQFLKPTVVTLVYGLGFGMLLVLLLVPALMAMQDDVERQLSAARRAFRSPARARARGVTLATGAGLLAVLAGFAATLGHVLTLGTLWPPVGEALAMTGAVGSGTALGLFLIWVAAALLVIWMLAVVVLSLRGRKCAVVPAE